MRRVYSFSRRSFGFTLVELIAVMVIMGVLSAIAIPKFFERSVFDDNGFHDQVIAALRYAQKEAVAQHGFACVAFTLNSVTLTIGTVNTCGTTLINPAGGGAYVIQSSHSAFSTLPSNFNFDCLGIPRTYGMGTCNDILGVLSSAQTVQVQNTTAITVEMETGYVHSP